MNKTKKILITAALVVLLALLIALSAWSLLREDAPETSATTTDAIAVNGTLDDGTSAPTTTAQSPTTSSDPAVTSELPVTTTAAPPVIETPFDTVSLPSGDMYTGSLIVVNRENPYCYRAASTYTPTELDRLTKSELAELGFVSLYGQKSTLYLLRSRLIFLKTEVYQGFLQMMTDYVAKSGNRDVQVRFGYQLVNAAPDVTSLSDHRATGLVVEINVYTDEGTFSIDHVSKRSAYYEWFAANCYRYGFIMTGESGLFRYVGAPHAEYMTKKHLDLEEYVDLVAGYSYQSPLAFVDGGGVLWQVYTVPASSGSLTEIKLPKDTVYSVSGNNKNGFIVLTRGK